jgi:FlaA1/EpsC-like NDP-sugar epimerase
MKQQLLAYRRPLIVLLHIGLIIAANYLAFLLRFDGDIPAYQLAQFVDLLPWLVAVRGATFFHFRLYNGLWQYTSIWDLRNIIAGVTVSTTAFYVLVHWIFGTVTYPRSVFVMDSVLLIFFMGGIRLTRRFTREWAHLQGRKHLLILGAGDAGEMIVRDIKRDGAYRPIGFVDDDPRKTGHWIHGVEVLGTRQDLARIMEEERPHEILVAIPSAKPAAMRALVKALEPYRVPITTLPNVRHLLDGKVSLTQVRQLSIEDLLPRAPAGLDVRRVRGLLEGKRVLVTGAGGSIGSELCRQILRLEPSELVLYERYENSLYAIENDLRAMKEGACVRACIGDVTDLRRLDRVLGELQPHVIFHAAAHKHVPMMEKNPCEGVKNNVMGTRMVAEAAARHGVERFILISSDKAVNPTSVMGATKRVAELIVQNMALRSATSFATVRFGNVLGSNGSVVLRFLDQIKAGGPVTVTHPDVRRYFMLISEAVQLVLHAAALARGGETFVLQMGEQIKVVDLARNVIRLSGFVPDEQIRVTFVGLRPGEKLSEELVGDGERLAPSGVEKVLRVHDSSPAADSDLMLHVTELARIALRGDADAVIKKLCFIVPSFTPNSAVVPEVPVTVTRMAVPPQLASM